MATPRGAMLPVGVSSRSSFRLFLLCRPAGGYLGLTMENRRRPACAALSSVSSPRAQGRHASRTRLGSPWWTAGLDLAWVGYFSSSCSAMRNSSPLRSATLAICTATGNRWSTLGGNPNADHLDPGGAGTDHHRVGAVPVIRGAIGEGQNDPAFFLPRQQVRRGIPQRPRHRGAAACVLHEGSSPGGHAISVALDAGDHSGRPSRDSERR